jgi:hypothetical protein
MIRFRTLLCAASAACGITLGLGANAQNTLNIQLPSAVTCSGNGTTITCTANGGTPQGPSCTLNASTTSATIGSNVTLTTNCSNTTGAISYGFDDSGGRAPCSQQSGAICTFTEQAAGNYVITATASDANGSIPVSPASKTITFSTVVGGGGGGAIPQTCTDGSTSVTGPTITSFDGLPITATIANGQTAIFPVVIPAGKMVQLGYVQTKPNDGTLRWVWFSKTPCAVTPGPAIRTSLSPGTFQGGSQVALASSNGSLNVSVGTGSNVAIGRGTLIANAQPGETWYFMFQNKGLAGEPSCSASTCNVVINPIQINN